jgi:hypothetical protein
MSLEAYSVTQFAFHLSQFAVNPFLTLQSFGYKSVHTRGPSVAQMQVYSRLRHEEAAPVNGFRR